MVVAIRVSADVDDQELKKALEKYSAAISTLNSGRIARGNAIVDYQLKEGVNPILTSITKQLKERAASDEEEFNRVLATIVGKELKKARPTNNLIWNLLVEEIKSPIDGRLISNKQKVGPKDDLRFLQALLASRLEKDFILFITADLAAQERKKEIPVPPNVKAIEVRMIAGSNLGTFKSTTKFISNLQFTVLVRRQLAARMPKGSVRPRLPQPNPSRGLTFRSGKFVNTTEFAINYRNRLIEYFIRPPYTAFLDSANPLITRYQPDIKNLTPAIRDIAKTVAAEQFNIVRSKSPLL